MSLSKMVLFHSYVTVYQRLNPHIFHLGPSSPSPGCPPPRLAASAAERQRSPYRRSLATAEPQVGRCSKALIFSEFILAIYGGVLSHGSTPQFSPIIYFGLGFSTIDHPFWGTPIYGNPILGIIIIQQGNCRD